MPMSESIKVRDQLPAWVFDPKGFDLNRLNREWKGARKRKP